MFKREKREITSTLTFPEREGVFIEFQGALCDVDEDGNMNFTPRGPIWIQLGLIGGFYDHTILLMGNKIRVMETAAQIAAKAMDARNA